MYVCALWQPVARGMQTARSNGQAMDPSHTQGSFARLGLKLFIMRVRWVFGTGTQIIGMQRQAGMDIEHSLDPSHLKRSLSWSWTGHQLEQPSVGLNLVQTCFPETQK